MMKLFKREIILWFIFLPFWSACILLTITARVNFDLNGFAVADGKLYVGLSNSVEIIENGRCVTKIPVSEFADGTSYVFALEDNQIAIYRPLKKEIREISGDVFSTEEYTDTAVFNAKFKKKRYIKMQTALYINKKRYSVITPFKIYKPVKLYIRCRGLIAVSMYYGNFLPPFLCALFCM